MENGARAQAQPLDLPRVFAASVHKTRHLIAACRATIACAVSSIVVTKGSFPDCAWRTVAADTPAVIPLRRNGFWRFHVYRRCPRQLL